IRAFAQTVEGRVMIGLTAVKQCGKYLPGKEFVAKKRFADVLVKLGRAVYRATDPDTIVLPEKIELPAYNDLGYDAPVYDVPVKRPRGRPKKVVVVE
ncbi:MAG: hypothetical protein ACRESZ_02735, partial [Methylococcales bacterium]